MKKKIGLILAILGVFVIIIQPAQQITGAVIDLSTIISKTNFIIGLLLIIIGAVLVFLEKNN